MKLYLWYVILRKNHRLRTMIFSKFFRHWWNEMTFRKRYLHKSLSNLTHNCHENRLLIMINFSKQNATNCIKFCEKLSRNFNKWMKRLMQRNQTIDDVFLQIIFNNLTKKNFLKFNADWINELMKKKMFVLRFQKFREKWSTTIWIWKRLCMLFIVVCKMMKKLSKNQKQKFEMIYRNFTKISLRRHIFQLNSTQNYSILIDVFWWWWKRQSFLQSKTLLLIVKYEIFQRCEWNWINCSITIH